MKPFSKEWKFDLHLFRDIFDFCPVKLRIGPVGLQHDRDVVVVVQHIPERFTNFQIDPDINALT